ncbi:DUF2182 domain-containing protein [Halococcus agarilyticus]|uniref:DUF2182 domain-containing protein n=1 Tax=Halococcus agarilyticus TaxID=1232219 RepID=UPI000677B5C2|nr:DUF2182 domain-containing protein [Halococcus agarilyticus]
MSVGHRVAGRFAAAFRLPLDRATTAVVAMLGIDVLWWVLTIGGAVPMPGMAWLMEQGIPMTAPGAMERGVAHAGTVDAVLGYLVMWGVMMWAMMHPAMLRFVRSYADAHEGTAFAATAAVTTFLGGYLGVWALSGMIPLAVDAVLPGGIYGFTRAHTHLAIGGALVLAGGYQLSAFKQSLLDSCCANVCSHATGAVAALAEGVRHGARCVLISFGVFFLVMPVFGEMNPFWMVALTGVVALERLPEWGREVAVGSGVVAVLAGLVVWLTRPSLPVAFGM